MQAYEGYFEDGRFHPLGKAVLIPERRRALVTILDEPARNESNGIVNPIPILDSKKDRSATFGCLKGKITVPDNFNEPRKTTFKS